ncbi:helix-turn-helix domain-containing protein [Bacteroidia bacterium]|nr:helix-turn-helix domain-containing protein [Bacteroidia bacterium]
MVDIKLRLGVRIKQLRREKGVSQEKLSEIAGLDRTYMTDIENGKRNVSIVVLEKLAMAFKFSLSELLKDI